MLTSGDVAHVGEVGRAAEAVAGDLLTSVGDGDALEAGSEEVNASAGGGIDAMDLDARAGGVAVLPCGRCTRRCVRSAAGLFVGVDGKVVLTVKAERAQVVEAHDVVGVPVGVEDGIDVADILAQGLGVEVRAGVDEDGAVVVGESDGRAGAAVARVSDPG